MMINEISADDCRAVLERASVGRLGCALNNEPYVVPIYLAYESDYIYVFSTFGKKIEWMRENPKVCVEVEESGTEVQWVSVLANGTYQELVEPQFSTERTHARKLLEKHHHWWLNALAERHAQSENELIEPLFFRIHVDTMTGLRSQNERTGAGR